MEQHDYIMRQINQLTEVLKTVLSKIINTPTDNENDIITIFNNELTSNIHINFKNLTNDTNEEILKRIENLDNFSPDQLGIISDIIAEIAYKTQRNKYTKKILSASLFLLNAKNKYKLPYSFEDFYKINKLYEIVND